MPEDLRTPLASPPDQVVISGGSSSPTATTASGTGHGNIAGLYAGLDMRKASISPPSIASGSNADGASAFCRSAVGRVLQNEDNLLDRILEHLYDDLLDEGREPRQAQMRRLTIVAKAWEVPASRKVYKNPYFGTAHRAQEVAESLQANPHRGALVKKLIFGEGSSTDITDWHYPETVPRILRACPNVNIVGFDGLHNVDLDQFRDALLSRLHLEEIRACDLMPHPWTSVTYFFDQIISQCRNVVRLRLYSLHSQDEHDMALPKKLRPKGPQPLKRGLVNVSLNSCSINANELRAIFANSATTLQRLYLEYPMGLLDDDLVHVLRLVGHGLKELSIEGYEDQRDASKGVPDTTVCRILKYCPNLEILNFADAIANLEFFERVQGSKLKVWSFTTQRHIRPEHWLKAFKNPEFPRNARCRIFPQGWTQSDVRRVRIAAWDVGLSWLINGDELIPYYDS